MGLAADLTPSTAQMEAKVAAVSRRSALDLDIHASCSALVEELTEPPNAVGLVQDILAGLDAGQGTASDALSRVADLLIDPSCTVSVAAQFKPVLLELLARVLKRIDASNGAHAQATIQTTHAFALLISIFPEIHE